jgi:aerobic-type carbon monoxide dehydrogenase small subunit (CoxS/CutS family)
MSKRHAIQLKVNDRPHEAEVPTRLLLADLLRHELGLTGTHIGCEHGVCGACTVQVDSAPVRSCLMLAVQADGCSVRTVEGLAAADGALHALQEAFRKHHALQCGFCTPGILMSAAAFLRDHREPNEAQVRDMLSGHICRCTGYQGIVDAVLEAAELLRAGAGAPK